MVDSAAAITMQRKPIRAVVVGADRIARNGDTANKIGTYGVAIAAAYHGIPFYIAAPRSTFDFSIESGEQIPIEERKPDEVRIAADDPVYNPAFDVTPGRAGRRLHHRVRRHLAALRRRHPRPRDPAEPGRARALVKFYDFLDKQPKIDGLVVIEGEDAILAQRALDAVLDRLLPPDMRALNCDVFDGPAIDGVGRAVGDAVNAMPFLAERRVVVVRNCQRMRAQPRRDLWAVAERVPAGNTLVLEDLFAPNKKTKPEPFGAMAGRKATRIDTTPNADVRERFVRETLDRLGAKAQPRVIADPGRGRRRPGRDPERPREAGPGRRDDRRSPTSSARACRSRTPRPGSTPARWSRAGPPTRWRSPSSCSPTTRAARACRWPAPWPGSSRCSGSWPGPAAAPSRPATAGASASCARSRAGSASAGRGSATRPRCAGSRPS